MTQNSRLVEYFTSKFYNKKTLDLGHVTSNRFTFCVNGGELQSFKAYASRRTLFTNNVILELGEFISDDDLVFVSEFNATPPDGKIVYGVCKITIVRGLLDKVEVAYKLSKKEMSDFEAKLEGNVVYV